MNKKHLYSWFNGNSRVSEARQKISCCIKPIISPHPLRAGSLLCECNEQQERGRGPWIVSRCAIKKTPTRESKISTLREGNSHAPKAAFTLAEVLITLAIIGVVAAMTIPTLITANQQRGWNTAATVFERKLEESLKVMNSQGTLAGYKNTFDFVNELSKHLKITKICKNDDLMSCFEDKVMWGSGEATPEEVDMTKIKTAKNFGQNDWGTDLLGIQLANGTSGLIAYNPECKQDMFSNQITGTSCLALLYDTSGFTKPNTSGKDLRSINVTKLGSSCAFEIGGTCYGTPFIANTPHVWKGCDASGTTTTNEDDLAFMAKYNIQYCLNSDYGTADYWAGAVEACGGLDKMPTMAQVAQIADYVYGTSGIGAKEDWDCPSGSCRDDDKASALSFTVTSGRTFWVWSNEEHSSVYAYGRYFNLSNTHWFGKLGYSRGGSEGQVVCLVE